MVDLEGSRVREVAEERTEEAAEKLWETLPEEQHKQIRALAMDMWQPYFKATQTHAPEAEMVHRRYSPSRTYSRTSLVIWYSNSARADGPRVAEPKRVGDTAFVLDGDRQWLVYCHRNGDEIRVTAPTSGETWEQAARSAALTGTTESHTMTRRQGKPTRTVTAIVNQEIEIGKPE